MPLYDPNTNWLGFMYKDKSVPGGPVHLEIELRTPDGKPPVVIGSVSIPDPQIAALFVQSVCHSGQNFHLYQPPEGPRVTPFGAVPPGGIIRQ